MLSFLASSPHHFVKPKLNGGFSLLESVIALTIFTMLALSVATNIITNQQFIASNINLLQTEVVAHSVSKLVSAIPYSDLAIICGEGRKASIPLPLGNKFFLLSGMSGDNASTRVVSGPVTDFIPRMRSSSLFVPSDLRLMGEGQPTTLNRKITERSYPFTKQILKRTIRTFGALSVAEGRSEIFINKEKKLAGGKISANPRYYTLFNYDPVKQTYSAHRMDYQCTAYMSCLKPKELIYIQVTSSVMSFLAAVGGFQGFRDFFGDGATNNSSLRQRSLGVIVKPSTYEMAYY